MRPEPTFIAERALAQHCPELFERGNDPSSDPLDAFGRLGTALARDVGASLAPLLGAEGLSFAATPPAKGDLARLAERIEPLAANSLLSIGGEGARMLVSIDAATVFEAVDRAFGGKGEVPSPFPEAFAPSSEMMARRLTARVTAMLCAALSFEADAVQVLRAHASLASLEPFTADTPLALVSLVAERAGSSSRTIQLALPLAALASSVGEKSRKPPSPGAPSAQHQPWSDVPLNLSAVLVDMRLPMSALAGLRPDVILPVAVAREVPLRVGATTLARGTVGTLDDRVAIQITQAF